MIKLEQYFSGEENWIKLSNYCASFWSDSDIQSKLLAYLENRIDLAQVIYYHLQGNSISWIYSKVPALDNLTPIECLKTEQTTKRLKVCLMRMD